MSLLHSTKLLEFWSKFSKYFLDIVIPSSLTVLQIVSNRVIFDISSAGGFIRRPSDTWSVQLNQKKKIKIMQT
jgi:hypothetical protein